MCSVVLAPLLSVDPRDAGATLYDCVATEIHEHSGARSRPQRSACGGTMTPEQFKTEMIGLLPRLRRFAMSLTRSAPDADDLLQDACAAALQKWHQYDPTQPLDRWLFRIIRNLWVSEIRKRKVRQGEGQVPAEESPELQVNPDADVKMTVEQVKARVANMDPDLARPLMLVCAEGYSYREVSELLDVPVGTVMSRIHRARQHLMKSLAGQEAV